MKILIIANARYKGGLSGSDNIYLNFKKHWPADMDVWEMMDIDFKPFALCYLWRIALSCLKALICFKRYDFVYSASDFLMDSLPAFIMKLKGNKWVAGFYLYAFTDNKIYYTTQNWVIKIIKRFADIVSVTNGSMYPGFPGKKKIWINGGIDLSLTAPSQEPKIYDAVFCGRLHPSKGIDELLESWNIVRQYKPSASLALIGDGDLGKQYIIGKLFKKYSVFNGITLFGYMGDERYAIYKKSKVVLYPAVVDHFSMAPVEAMACGCPMIAYALPVMEYFEKELGLKGCGLVHGIGNVNMFAYTVLDYLQGRYLEKSAEAIFWASQFDYKKESLRVLKEITNGLQKPGKFHDSFLHENIMYQ